MWNIWGLQTVQITFSDGKRFLIGTDDPEGLTRGFPLSLNPPVEILWLGLDRRGKCL